MSMSASRGHKKHGGAHAHAVAFTVCGSRIDMCNWGYVRPGGSRFRGYGKDALHSKLADVYDIDRLLVIVDCKHARLGRWPFKRSPPMYGNQLTST